MVVGAMLAYTHIDPDVYWFVPLLFLLLRPLAVWIGLLGATPAIAAEERLLISWFGIRGIGSIYYLVFAIGHGLPAHLADKIAALTLTTVAASIIVHGISVTPLMSRYARRSIRRTKLRRQS